MTLFSLHALSWGTVAGAVTCALLLAAREPAAFDYKHNPSRPGIVPASSNPAPAPRVVRSLVQAHPQQIESVTAPPR